MAKTLLVMAGGTGGHVFPGIAVAKQMQHRGWRIHWLGTAQRMEADIVPKAGFDISFISVSGVRGNGMKRLLAAPFQIIRSVWQAKAIIKQQQPDVVLGMGGFASGPGGLAAWLTGVPVVVHEQNALPGLTNKLLARIAKRVLSGFDGVFDAQHVQPNKFQWVGNPVRDEFAQLPPKTLKSGPFNLLIVGGSLGAKALNDNVPKALIQLNNICVHHQSGKGHAEQVRADYSALIGDRFDWQVSEFIDDMAHAFDWADLVICRAGALTVAEIAMAGLTAIFVPLPHAVDDHQTFNAKALSDHDAGYLLPQQQLQKGELSSLLVQLLNHPQQLINKGQNAKNLAKPDATQRVCDICEQLAGVAA